MAEQRWIFSCVERGWAASRMCALELKGSGVLVRHYIKGRVPPEVLDLIEPYPHITIRSLPRPLFRVFILFRLFGTLFTGRPEWILIDFPKTGRHLKPIAHLLGSKILLVEMESGSPKLSRDGKPLTLPECFDLAGKP